MPLAPAPRRLARDLRLSSTCFTRLYQHLHVAAMARAANGTKRAGSTAGCEGDRRAVERILIRGRLPNCARNQQNLHRGRPHCWCPYPARLLRPAAWACGIAYVQVPAAAPQGRPPGAECWLWPALIMRAGQVGEPSVLGTARRRPHPRDPSRVVRRLWALLRPWPDSHAREYAVPWWGARWWIRRRAPGAAR